MNVVAVRHCVRVPSQREYFKRILEKPLSMSPKSKTVLQGYLRSEGSRVGGSCISFNRVAQVKQQAFLFPAPDCESCQIGNYSDQDARLLHEIRQLSGIALW